MKNVDESSERVVRRIEAFSDIVIGFSLAQLSLSLGIPAHTMDIITKPVPLIAFVITFTIVARLWWSHHRLFTNYFVPNPFTITLNFVTLGVLLFCVYTVQLLAHSLTTVKFDPAALALYTGSFSVLFLLLGVQYLTGWRIRRAVLAPDLVQKGLSDGVRLIVVGLVFGVGVAITLRFGAHATSFMYVVVIALLVASLSRFVIRRALP